MKKLVNTPEAESYTDDVRSKVVELAGVRILFEWRYWMALALFILAASIALRMVEGADLPWIGTIIISFLVLLPGMVLWSFVSWYLQRWVLLHRRDAFLHAVGRSNPDASNSTKQQEAEQAGDGDAEEFV